MSKLKEFLDKEKIDPRRILIASKQIEALRDEDRAIRLAKRNVRNGKPTDADKALADKKRRSGRPVTRPLLDKALEGKRVSPKAKDRIARAVNKVLETKMKKTQVSATDLF